MNLRKPGSRNCRGEEEEVVEEGFHSFPVLNFPTCVYTSAGCDWMLPPLLSITKTAALRDVSVTPALLAVKKNKVYLPDLPLIVCTWGLSVEKIPEKWDELFLLGQERCRYAAIPFFSFFFFANFSSRFSKLLLGQDRTIQRATGAGDCQ